MYTYRQAYAWVYCILMSMTVKVGLIGFALFLFAGLGYALYVQTLPEVSTILSERSHASLLASVIGDSGSAFFKTHTDTVPNFAQNPTVRSVKNGNWSDADTWSAGRVPSASDIVLVQHSVEYDSVTGNVDTIGIDAGGALVFKTDQNTKLAAANILVMPGGAFRIGAKGAPLPADYTAEVVIKNK